MRKWLLTLLVLAFSQVWAQSSVEKKLQEMGEQDAKGWIQPGVNGFGMGMNSGYFHTAKTHDLLGFDVKIVGMFALVPSSDKTFNSSLGEAPTIAGDGQTGSIKGGKLEVIPFAAPQVTVGLPFKTDVLLRYMPKYKVDKVGDITMFGLGFKHNLNQWIPVPLPLDIAGAFAYNNLEVGDFLKANSTSYHLLASKNLLLLTVYGGMAAESSSMDISYTQNDIGNTKVDFSATGKNKFRFYGGATIKLLLVFINADYSLGEYNAASIGLGVTLR